MSNKEYDWRAEDDARILAQYNEITSDKKRLNKAVVAAKSQANKLNKQVQNLKKVTKLKSNSSSKGGKKK